MKIHVEEIWIDPRLQARAAVDADAVESYREAYEAGVNLPPLALFTIEGCHHALDGFHRYAAARAAGLEFLPVEIVGEGSIEEAVWRATGVNQAHGLRRSNADKQCAVLMAIESPIGQEQSSRAIAEHVGVSVSFVSEIRKRWEAEQRAAGVAVSVTAVDSRGARRAKTRPVVSAVDTSKDVSDPQGSFPPDQGRANAGATAADESCGNSQRDPFDAQGRGPDRGGEAPASSPDSRGIDIQVDERVPPGELWAVQGAKVVGKVTNLATVDAVREAAAADLDRAAYGPEASVPYAGFQAALKDPKRFGGHPCPHCNGTGTVAR